MANFTAFDTHIHAIMTNGQLEAEYLATLALLEEALDYLVSLPPHPMTRSLAGKLQEHLKHPVRQLQREELVRAKSEISGCSVSPAGLQIIRATLNGAELSLTSPVLHSSGGFREMGPVVLRYLKKGERIMLRPTFMPPSDE